MMRYGFLVLGIVVAMALVATLFWEFGRGGDGASAGGETVLVKPFELTDMHGKTVTERDFLGSPTLYFFGFTHCPDVCPTQLGAMSVWLHDLGDDANRLKVLFVSVDYERDTPEKLAEYMQAFDSRIMAATGTAEQIENMAKNFMIYYAKVPLKNGDYTMNHTASVLMVDEKGNFKGILPMGGKDEEAEARLRELVRQ